MALTARGERAGRTMLTDEFSRETSFSLFHWLAKKTRGGGGGVRQRNHGSLMMGAPRVCRYCGRNAPRTQSW